MSLDLAACSDGELAALAVAGRADAFAEIMRRHRDAVYRMIRGHVGDEGEALDLTQDAFLSAWRALDRYDPTRPLIAWLSRIAINKCRDWGRRRAVRRFFTRAQPLTPEISDYIADGAPDAEAQAADRQALSALERAIATLPSNLKEPLLLCAIEGLSQAEAAAALSVSEKAIETRIYRARRQLSEKLAGLV